MSGGALKGLRVLDIASLHAAPLTAAMLSDFGADVIKVEPPEGDSLRPTRLWALVSRNKRSVTLNLRSPEGCEMLRKMVEQADVVIENFPPKTLAERGIGWAELSARNPRLVMVSISCFGQGGPYGDFPGNGTLAEAFAGFTHLIGDPGGPPMLPTAAGGDAIAALSAVIGTLAACYHRDVHGGPGQHVDVSLYEPILALIGTAVIQYQPGVEPPKRNGSKLGGGESMRNVYPCKDGYVVIASSTQRHLNEVVAVAGDASMAPTPDNADAVATAWAKGHTMDEIVATFRARRVPVVPVNDLASLAEDPQVKERLSLVHLQDAQFGPVTLPNWAPRMSATPGGIASTNPALGSSNEQVYGEMLGLSPTQLASLKAAGVI